MTTYRRRHIERRWQHGSTVSATPECTPDYLCFQMWVSHGEEEENHGNKCSGRNITMGGFSDTNGQKRGHHLWLICVSDIQWWMCLLLTAHIALGQLVFCFCFYIGSYTNVVQRLGKAASDERLLGLAKRAVLRLGYLVMESLISDEKDDMTTEDFDRFVSIIKRVGSLHKLGMNVLCGLSPITYFAYSCNKRSVSARAFYRLTNDLHGKHYYPCLILSSESREYHLSGYIGFNITTKKGGNKGMFSKQAADVQHFLSR